MTNPLHALAQQIDTACDKLDVGELKRSIETISNFPRQSLSVEENATLNFYAANTYAGLRIAHQEHQSWSWVQPTLEKEIYHLRLARSLILTIPIEELTNDLRSRITTNLANTLNHVGRSVEAIELWEDVIALNPNYSMAIGNKAQALFWYSKYLEQNDAQILFLKHSYIAFKKALNIGVENHATEHMLQHLTHLESVANWDSIEPEVPRSVHSQSKQEHEYRQWCAHNRLVLNPLNDLLNNIELNDSLTLPPITLSLAEKNHALPKVYGIFNQLKQEYVSARYLIFEAIQEQSNGLHFSDRGVILYDALDYRYYRLWIEKLKMAFLSAHAIFDKIAYLINEYWNLTLSANKIDFRSVWFSKTKPKPIFAEAFRKSDNWPLRGLHWLSKDFHHKSNTDRIVDPEAKVIHDIRNHIAHKYLRVHDHILAFPRKIVFQW